jgi:uncharacterized protein YjeT (DUF2065 family)
MRRARLSLWYPTTYLFMTGLFLLVAPEWATKLLLSNGNYGAVMPRMAGALALGLGVIVLQVIRHRIDSLYPTLVGVRVMFCAVWLGLYFISADPFFLVVFGVVALGMVWTAVAYLADRRANTVY